MRSYVCLAKILWRQTSRNYLQELLVGSGISIVFFVLFTFYPAIAFLVLMGYFCLYQLTCMFENEIFWEKREFQMLCIQENEIEFRFFYILCRILLDTVLVNVIVFLSGFIFLLLRNKLEFAALWISCWIGCFWMAPSTHCLGKKINKTWGILFAIAHIVLMVLVVILYVNRVSWVYRMLENPTVFDALGIVIYSIGYGILIDWIGKHCSGAKTTGALIPFLFRGLKRINIWVYKDYLLLWDKLAINFVSAILVTILLCSGSGKDMIPIFIFYSMTNDWFSVKQKKEYLLLKEDTLFLESIWKEDISGIRRSKYLTILTEIPIKLLLSSMFCLVFSVPLFPVMLFLLLAAAASVNMEFVKLYRRSRMTMLAHVVIKIAMTVLTGGVLFYKNYYVFAIAYNLAVIVMFGLQGKGIIEEKGEFKCGREQSGGVY